ncbi:MAG: TraR/DksA C4-type zinc finger protein [Bacteroidales bacterium]
MWDHQAGNAMEDKPDKNKIRELISSTRCGNLIPVGRLLVMPESTRCIRCSSL